MSAAFQFASNIKILKRAIKEWEVKKIFREEQELKFVESEIPGILDAEGGGMLTVESKEVFTALEGRRKMLLQDKEETWRLKSRAIWLESGDDNTKFFHAYARGRKSSNTIWSLLDSHCVAQTNFDEKARLGVSHFKNLFKDPPQVNIVEVIRVAQLFPSFVDAEHKLMLMEMVFEG